MATETKPPRTVLIAVDESDNSERAFHFYATQIHRPNDVVLVMHVQDEVPYMPAAPYPFAAAYYEEWETTVKAMKRRTTDLIGRYVTKCSAHGFKHFKPILETGTAGYTICKAAETEGADMIVLGSRGQGAFHRALLGSVSDYCVHHAHAPVAVIPCDDRHKHHGIDNKEAEHVKTA